jgi:hypothetical protein
VLALPGSRLATGCETGTVLSEPALLLPESEDDPPPPPGAHPKKVKAENAQSKAVYLMFFVIKVSL